MSPDFDDLVETSTSLGEAITEGDELTLHSLSRSSNDSALPEVIATLDAAARLAGGELEVKRNYGGWRPNLDSPALAAASAVYEREFGEPPIVTAVHAGLETAVIGSKVPGLDMLSFGPQIEFPHSPDERVSIPTVERFWKLLVAVRRRAVERRGSRAVRGPLAWILAGVGVLVVIVVAAAIGGRDESDETVPAGEWAQNVCGAVGVWRGEIEAIVEDIRTPSSQSSVGEEPQSETPQGRTGFVRKGLERAVQATETLVEGVDNAGIPDTEDGEEAAERRVARGPTTPWTSSRRRRTRSTTRRTRSRRRSSSSPTLRGRSPPCSRAARRRSSTSLVSTPSSRRRSATRARASSSERRGRQMSTTDWILIALQGARRHRLHRPRRALGRDRPRPLGRRRHARPRLRLRARPRASRRSARC